MKIVKPSYDCDKAITYAEVIICQDSELAESDNELARTYKSALARGGDKVFLRNMLNDWRKNERDKCKSIECIKSAYDQMIIELTAD